MSKLGFTYHSAHALAAKSSRLNDRIRGRRLHDLLCNSRAFGVNTFFLAEAEFIFFCSILNEI